MSNPVTLLSKLRANDESAAVEISRRLKALERTVPTEPGNLGYAVFRTTEDRTLFYIQESWSGPEDAARHVDRIAADPAVRKSATLLAGPIETVTLLALHATVADRPDHEGTA